MQGAGFRVQGAGCRVQGSGCRVEGGDAQELHEQRRQAVRSLRVVTPLLLSPPLHQARVPGFVLESHLSSSGEWKCTLRQGKAMRGTVGPYARPTDLTGFSRQHLQL